MDWLKGFLNQLWVRVVCIIMWVISTAVLIFDGVTVGELNDTAKLILGVLSAIGILIAGIRKLIQKNDTTSK